MVRKQHELRVTRSPSYLVSPNLQKSLDLVQSTSHVCHSERMAPLPPVSSFTIIATAGHGLTVWMAKIRKYQMETHTNRDDAP